MELHANMIRLRPKDLEDLTAASEKLAEVATSIGQWKSPAAMPVVALVRDVNDIVLRIRDRGLAKMTRVLGRIGDDLDRAARAKAAASEPGSDE